MGENPLSVDYLRVFLNTTFDAILANPSDIKKQFLQIYRKYHPDKFRAQGLEGTADIYLKAIKGIIQSSISTQNNMKNFSETQQERFLEKIRNPLEKANLINKIIDLIEPPVSRNQGSSNTRENRARPRAEPEARPQAEPEAEPEARPRAERERERHTWWQPGITREAARDAAISKVAKDAEKAKEAKRVAEKGEKAIMEVREEYERTRAKWEEFLNKAAEARERGDEMNAKKMEDDAYWWLLIAEDASRTGETRAMDVANARAQEAISSQTTMDILIDWIEEASRLGWGAEVEKWEPAAIYWGDTADEAARKEEEFIKSAEEIRELRLQIEAEREEKEQREVPNSETAPDKKVRQTKRFVNDLIELINYEESKIERIMNKLMTEGSKTIFRPEKSWRGWKEASDRLTLAQQKMRRASSKKPQDTTIIGQVHIYDELNAKLIEAVNYARQGMAIVEDIEQRAEKEEKAWASHMTIICEEYRRFLKLVEKLPEAIAAGWAALSEKSRINDLAAINTKARAVAKAKADSDTEIQQIKDRLASLQDKYSEASSSASARWVANNTNQGIIEEYLDLKLELAKAIARSPLSSPHNFGIFNEKATLEAQLEYIHSTLIKFGLEQVFIPKYYDISHLDELISSLSSIRRSPEFFSGLRASNFNSRNYMMTIAAILSLLRQHRERLLNLAEAEANASGARPGVIGRLGRFTGLLGGGKTRRGRSKHHKMKRKSLKHR
jgi:hypothetical protein